MVRQAGAPAFDENGMMRRGVIVRHLALPGLMEDSKKIIGYLFETFGDDICLSIMRQYTPMGMNEKFPEIARKITKQEFPRQPNCFSTYLHGSRPKLAQEKSSQPSFGRLRLREIISCNGKAVTVQPAVFISSS